MFLALSNCRLKHSYFKPGPWKHKALVGMIIPIVKQVCDFECDVTDFLHVKWAAYVGMTLLVL